MMVSWFGLVQDAERSDDGADGSASDVSSSDSHKVRINAG